MNVECNSLRGQVYAMLLFSRYTEKGEGRRLPPPCWGPGELFPGHVHIQLANTPSLRTRPGIAAGPWERGGMQLGPGVGRVTAMEKGRVSIGSASSQPGTALSPSESLVTTAFAATLGGGDQLPVYMSHSDQGPAASQWHSWALTPDPLRAIGALSGWASQSWRPW